MNQGKAVFDGRCNLFDYNPLAQTRKVEGAGGTKIGRRLAGEKKADDSNRFRFPGNESAFWGVQKGVFEAKNGL